MKGLLVKDIRFLMRQKSSMFIFVALGLFFLITGEDVSFAIMYTIILASLFSASSITYDSFENGMSYLLTLPIQKKTYVASKYIFSALIVVVMGMVLCGLAFACNALGITTLDLSTLGEAFVMAVTAAVVMFCIMIPIYVIFGAEKARIAIIILAGVIAAIGFIVSKVLDGKMAKVTELLSKLERLSKLQGTLLVIGILVVILIISILITTKGLEKKEY